MPTTDYDAIVIGAGHNGLVTRRVPGPGRTAHAAGRGPRLRRRHGRRANASPAATVNICNCDHITFRTTPVIDELDLAAHGLRYLDVEPSQLNMTWDGGPTVDELPRPRTARSTSSTCLIRPRSTAIGATQGGDAGRAKMVFEAANEPPSMSGSPRRRCAMRRRGLSTLLRWSRRSAADVMRSFFDTEALRGPALAAGPMVWGISPELPGTGLGALTYAMRHVGDVGRPVGGSGAVPETLRARVRVVRRPAARRRAAVEAISCDGHRRVRGVARRRHRDHARTSSCPRAIRTTRSCSGCATLPLRPTTSSSAGGRCRTTRATSRRSTPS